nr:PREDICTED: killer cell lectin-like receptor subfamily G member 1 [Lepisosteus oculatus]
MIEQEMKRQQSAHLEERKKEIDPVFCVEPYTGERKQQCCPEGWKGGDSGRCYYVSTDRRPWESASQFCSSVGAQLVVTEDKRELEMLRDLVQEHYYWMGLSRRDSSAVWTWSGGRELNNEMVTLKEGSWDGDCAYGHWSQARITLYSRKCEGHLHWICEQRCVSMPVCLSSGNKRE